MHLALSIMWHFLWYRYMGGDNHDGSLKIGIWVYILLLNHCVASGKPLPYSMSVSPSNKWSSNNVHLGDFDWTKLEGCSLNFLEWWWLSAASLYFLLEAQRVWVTRVSSYHNLFWKKVSFLCLKLIFSLYFQLTTLQSLVGIMNESFIFFMHLLIYQSTMEATWGYNLLFLPLFTPTIYSTAQRSQIHSDWKRYICIVKKDMIKRQNVWLKS